MTSTSAAKGSVASRLLCASNGATVEKCGTQAAHWVVSHWLQAGCPVRPKQAQRSAPTGALSSPSARCKDASNPQGRDYGDKPTFVRIPAAMKDGRVEVDVWARRSDKAPKDARAVVGLTYRINADASAYESVYLRPVNDRRLNPPAPRDRRADADPGQAHSFNGHAEHTAQTARSAGHSPSQRQYAGVPDCSPFTHRETDIMLTIKTIAINARCIRTESQFGR